MTTSAPDSTLKTARFAGILYFIFAVLGIYVFMYVQPKIMVRNDAAGTLNNMVTHEFLYRTSLVANVITDILFIAVALILYRLLKHVNINQARMMVVIVLISIPIALMGDILEITALGMIKGGTLSSFQEDQARQIAFMLVKISSTSGQMLTLPWGLWLLPLAYLVYKSGFIPKIFGILLLINGLGYVINNFFFLLLPDLQPTVVQYIFPTYFMGELPFIFWLLIKGARVEK